MIATQLVGAFLDGLESSYLDSGRAAHEDDTRVLIKPIDGADSNGLQILPDAVALQKLVELDPTMRGGFVAQRVVNRAPGLCLHLLALERSSLGTRTPCVPSRRIQSCQLTCARSYLQLQSL